MPSPKQPQKANQQLDSEQKNRKQRKQEERQKIRQDNQKGPDPRTVLDFGVLKPEDDYKQDQKQAVPDNSNDDPEKQSQLEKNQRRGKPKKKNQVLDPSLLGFSVDLKKDYNIVGVDDEE